MQTNKEVVKSLYEQALNQQNLPLLQHILSESYVGPQGETGPKGFEQTIVPLLKAFPDIHYDIEDLVEEGDKVVIRWKWHGTHSGTFRNYPPTGKTVINEGMAIFRLKDHKIVAAAVQTDRLGFLQAIGVIPAELPQPATGIHINLIDKFFVPANAKSEFYERMRINRDFIRTLPGFIRDNVYTSTDENSNISCVTIAVWNSKEDLAKAKEAVQAEYRKEGFDMPAMLKRLNIQIDRGTYSESPEQ